MVLDALEQIRQAEEHVQKMKSDAQQELTDYETTKEKEVSAFQKNSQDKVKKLLQEAEQLHQEQLEQEKSLLLKDSEKQQASFKSKYDENKEQMIDYIIERVNGLYGSQ